MICDINNFINKKEFTLRTTDNNKWQELLSSKGLEEKFLDKDKNFIIKYKKNLLEKPDYINIGKLRSVVCQNDKVLSFSPPKCLDYNEFISRISNLEIKNKLISNTSAAVARGVFGAPTMFVGEEMFFGQDRFDFIEDCISH